DNPQPAEDRGRRRERARVSGSAARVRQLRRVCLALRRREGEEKRLENPVRASGLYAGSRGHEPGPAVAGLPFCRADHLLRSYANHRNGKRPSRRLLLLPSSRQINTPGTQPQSKICQILCVFFASSWWFYPFDDNEFRKVLLVV